MGRRLKAGFNSSLVLQPKILGQLWQQKNKQLLRKCPLVTTPQNKRNHLAFDFLLFQTDCYVRRDIPFSGLDNYMRVILWKPLTDWWYSYSYSRKSLKPSCTTVCATNTRQCDANWKSSPRAEKCSAARAFLHQGLLVPRGVLVCVCFLHRSDQPEKESKRNGSVSPHPHKKQRALAHTAPWRKKALKGNTTVRDCAHTITQPKLH